MNVANVPFLPCECGGSVENLTGPGRVLDGCSIPDQHPIPTCIVCGDMFTNEDDLEIARSQTRFADSESRGQFVRESEDIDSDECDDSSDY